MKEKILFMVVGAAILASGFLIGLYVVQLQSDVTPLHSHEENVDLVRAEKVAIGAQSLGVPLDEAVRVGSEMKKMDPIQPEWEQYTNEALGFSLEFPEEYGLSGWQVTEKKWQGFLGRDADSDEGMPYVVANFITNQRIEDFEQINNRIVGLKDSTMTINGLPVRKIVREFAPEGVAAFCPIYYFQIGASALTLHTHECLDWEYFDGVVNSVQRL